MSSQEDSQPSQDSTSTLTEENCREIICFAYGPNLSTQEMLNHCPNSTPIGLGHLPGWRWIINDRGYANIVNDHDTNLTGPGVYGLLYLLPPQDEDSLDIHEGVPWAYDKVTMEIDWVRDDQGRALQEKVMTLVYVDEERIQENLPKKGYVERMMRGIEEAVEDWGMDETYADVLIERLSRGTQL